VGENGDTGVLMAGGVVIVVDLFCVRQRWTSRMKEVVTSFDSLLSRIS